MRLSLISVVCSALVAFVLAQTPMTCPPNFVPADSCTQGPCRCAQFNTIYIGTSAGVTTVRIRVTNLCPDPVYYVQFAVLDSVTGKSLTVTTPSTNNGAYNSVYQWTASIYDGTVAPQSSPPLKWLRFTPSSSAVPPVNTLMSTPTSSLPYDEFQFTVTGYYPVFQWYYQLHQGANWDTYGPIDNSLCQCGNCDAGFAQRKITSCTLGYPAASAAPPNYRPPSIFNENEALYAFQIEGNQLEMFYTDEHALTLGINSVVDTSGKTTNYPITAQSNTPACVSGGALQTGSTNFDGTNQQSAIDGNAAASGCAQDTAQFPCGRPLTPVLFITDISSNPNSVAGDWQYGGTAVLPQKVCGVWKGGTKTVTGANGPVWNFNLQLQNDPASTNINGAKNGWNLGPGADPIPLNNIQMGAWVQPFGAEISWNIDNLNLIPASTYRFQFIVHDGDQTRTGGDVGEACINVQPACPAGFTGTNCAQCDLNPQPGDGSYTYFCFPTGITSDPYTLLKIPTSKLSDPIYKNSGGFVPGPGKTDGQGFTVTCNCKRNVFTCPSSCCSVGTCFAQNGTCDCSAVPSLEQPDPNTCCPNVPIPPLCLNGGLYCSGHGFCNGNTCTCSLGADGTPDWTGAACNISVPKQKTCGQLTGVTDCNSCNAAATANSIYCTWCTPYPLSNATNLVVGTCTDAGTCQAQNLTLNPTCTVLTNYIPPPCPDQCSGHGSCVNTTVPQSQFGPGNPACAGANQKGCQNATSVLSCVCTDGYTGVNCGAAPVAITTIAATITAGAIVGIIIAIAVVVAACAGGGYAISQNLASAPVAPAINNPLYIPGRTGGDNPLHQV